MDISGELGYDLASSYFADDWNLPMGGRVRMGGYTLGGGVDIPISSKP